MCGLLLHTKGFSQEPWNIDVIAESEEHQNIEKRVSGATFCPVHQGYKVIKQ